MPAESTRSIRKPRNRYILKDGSVAPGVTTVLRHLNKEALVEWAFRLGKEHPELPSVRAYVDELANIGKATHAMVEAHLNGVLPDLSDFTPRDVEAAKEPFGKFLEWWRGRNVKVLATEKIVISEKFRYGGTLDILADIDGKRTVLDVKTSRGIYDEHFIQTAAYAQAEFETSGEPVQETRILRIGRVGSEGFEDRPLTDWRTHLDLFACLRRIHELDWNLKNNVPYKG